FLQVSATPDHQPALANTFHWNILIIAEREQLTDHHNPVSAKEVVGNGYIFAGRFGGSRTQRIIFDFPRPAYIRFAFQGFIPPFLIDPVIVVHWNIFLEALYGMPVQQNAVEMVLLPKSGEAGFFQKFFQDLNLLTPRGLFRQSQGSCKRTW